MKDNSQIRIRKNQGQGKSKETSQSSIRIRTRKEASGGSVGKLRKKEVKNKVVQRTGGNVSVVVACEDDVI